MPDKQSKPETPPYVSWVTFKNFIQAISENGIPARIDKSAMMNLSGGVQAALIAACKWLVLIDESGVPQEKLKRLVSSSDDEFGGELKAILTESYGFLIDELDLANATGAQVEEAFRERFGISGSTVHKTMSFFLKAAKEAGIKVSPYVKPPKITPSSKTSKKKPAPQRSEGKQTSDQEKCQLANEESPEVPGMVKITVPLHGMEDGQILFQENMGREQWDYALKMAKLILENYRPDTSEETK